MIAINSEILDEAEIIGGVAKLIKIQMWEPNEWGVKLIISAADYDHELIEEWEFSDEQKAKEVFEDLSSKAIC